MNDSTHRLSAEQLISALASLEQAFAIYTTQDIIIETANDAMISFWGKDRSVIGKPLEEAVPELKGQPFKKMLQDVLTTGITDEGLTPATLSANGQLQTFYYEYKYQALKDGSGVPWCILHTAADVTERERSKLQLQAAAELEEQQKIALLESESRFRSLVMQAPVAIAVFKTHDLLIDIVNENMLAIWGKQKSILGKPLAIAMPELEGQPFVGILQDVIRTGQPFYGSEYWAQIVRNGKLIEGWFNFICQPFKNEQGEVDSVLQVVTEITDQVKSRTEMQEANQKIRLAIDAARLGSWSIDPVSKNLVYNDTLARIFGYEGDVPMTYEQAIGQVTDEYRDYIQQEIEKAITDGGDYDITYSQRRFNDNELIWLRSIGKIGGKDNSEFSGFVMDITELKKDEIRKNDFIGMVSHELKTPLTTLTALVQISGSKLRNNADPFLAGVMDKANAQVKKMKVLINSFLNVSRLEAGKIHIHRQRFDMAQLVKEVEEESIITVTSHKVIFAPVVETYVNADRDKIGQVVNNFISNAVKYSPNGSTVQVAYITVDNNVQVSVRDEGMGIEPADQPKIFERYYRVESQVPQTVSGFGIGLYICAEIIHRHEGRIWLESTPGQGSTFYFSLPLG